MSSKLPIPRVTKVQIRLTEQDAAEIDQRRIKLKLTRPAVVELAVREWLERAIVPVEQSISTKTGEKFESPGSSISEDRITILRSDGADKIEVTAEEWEWVQRVLAVARCGVQQVQDALKKNFGLFEWTMGIVHDSQTRARAAVSGAAVDPKKSVTELRESQGRMQDSLDRAGEAKKDSERPGGLVRPRRKPDKGSPRSGS